MANPPTFTSLLVTDVGYENPYSRVGQYVQGVSVLSIIAVGAAASSGTTVKQIRVSGLPGGVITQPGNMFATALVDPGTYTLSVRVIDGRGEQSAARTTTITVLAYQQPQLTARRLTRSNAAGTPFPDGASAVVSVDAVIAPLTHGGLNLNRGTLRVEWRAGASGAWQSSVVYQNASTYTFVQDLVIGGDTFQYDQAYTVRIILEDKVGVAVRELSLGGEMVALSIGQAGIGVGTAAHPTRALTVKGSALVGDTLTAQRIVELAPARPSVLDGGKAWLTGSTVAANAATPKVTVPVPAGTFTVVATVSNSRLTLEVQHNPGDLSADLLARNSSTKASSGDIYAHWVAIGYPPQQ